MGSLGGEARGEDGVVRWEGGRDGEGGGNGEAIRHGGKEEGEKKGKGGGGGEGCEGKAYKASGVRARG